MEVSAARRLKALEDENAKLKRLLAEAMLDNAVLKDITARKWCPLCQRSCRLNRIGTFGGADSRKWLDTDKRTKIG